MKLKNYKVIVKEEYKSTFIVKASSKQSAESKVCLMSEPIGSKQRIISIKAYLTEDDT